MGCIRHFYRKLPTEVGGEPKRGQKKTHFLQPFVCCFDEMYFCCQPFPPPLYVSILHLCIEFANRDHLSTKTAFIREVLQTEFRYDFRKGPREISAGTVFTVFKAMMHINTVPAEISQGPFQKSYRNSVCKTSLFAPVGGHFGQVLQYLYRICVSTKNRSLYTQRVQTLTFWYQMHGDRVIEHTHLSTQPGHVGFVFFFPRRDCEQQKLFVTHTHTGRNTYVGWT